MRRGRGMTYYIYQEHEHGGYLTLVETITLERITKMHKTMMNDTYGSFSRFIYKGWEKTNSNIVGWLYIRNINSLRKVKTYITKGPIG